MKGLRLLCASALVAAAFAASATAAQQAGKPFVRVPNVQKLYLNFAEVRLRGVGLVPREQPPKNVYTGLLVRSSWQVCKQFPHPGARVRRGSKINLFFSKPGYCRS